MYTFRLSSIKIVCLLFLTSINLAHASALSGWTVKIVNLTDETISVDIVSSQKYIDTSLKQRECSFKNETVDANSSKDFKYKNISVICHAPCTKSVRVKSPVQLSAGNPLSSCSDVVVIIKQDESGKWSIEYRDWSDAVLKLIEERKKMPIAVRNMCNSLSGSPIQSISVFRKPIQAGINELISSVTKNEMKKLNYDDLYHTGFIITCQDKMIQLERNETVSNKIISPDDIKDLELREITLPAPVNYDEFINNAVENDPNFWKYHPIRNNCQLFVLQCLKKNDVDVAEDLFNFIYQDARTMLADNPKLREFAVGVTNFANRANNLIEKADQAYKSLNLFK